MNFLKKLFGLTSQDTEYIGLSGFMNSSRCLEDKKPEPQKKTAKKEPTLTELLKRVN